METLEEMRRRAEVAERRANQATGVEREAFLRIAKNWRRLVELIEDRWGAGNSR
jgi:hypothetical protein